MRRKYHFNSFLERIGHHAILRTHNRDLTEARQEEEIILGLQVGVINNP